MLDEMILSTIDQIHDSEGFAESAVTLKLIDCYEKAFDIINECDQFDMACYDIFSESFIQEGETWESIKDAGRKAKESAKGKEDESKLKKFLLAIPRLIITFINQLIKNIKSQIAKFTNEKKKKAVEDARKVANFAHESTDKFEEVVEKYADKWRDDGIEITKKGIRFPTITEEFLNNAISEFEKFVDDCENGREPKMGANLRKVYEYGKSKSSKSKFNTNVTTESATYTSLEAFDVQVDDDVYTEADAANTVEKKQGISRTISQAMRELHWDYIPDSIKSASDTTSRLYIKRLEKVRAKAEKMVSQDISSSSQYTKSIILRMFAIIEYILTGFDFIGAIDVGFILILDGYSIPISLLSALVAFIASSLPKVIIGGALAKAGNKAERVSDEMDKIKNNEQ